MKLFTPVEMQVMQVLWQQGKLKPAEIQEKFSRPIRNAALRSILLVLLAKGHVRRTKVGKAYYYEASTPRGNAFRKLMRRMAEVFCGGSTVSLIAELVKSEKLSRDDVRELQRIAQQTEQPKGKERE